jgi:hypothetical protein
MHRAKVVHRARHPQDFCLDATTLCELLDSPEIAALCAELESLRWTGRKGYGQRPAVRFQRRTRARAALRSRRLLGAPQRNQHEARKRLLRVQAARGGLLAHRASARVARRNRPNARSELGRRPLAARAKADRLHPLIPRESKRWRDLYRGRASVEREFGRLKHEWGLGPLRVRGLQKVALHAGLASSPASPARSPERAPSHSRRRSPPVTRQGAYAPASIRIEPVISPSFGLSFLPQSQPLADLCHEISHGTSLRRFASRFVTPS